MSDDIKKELGIDEDRPADWFDPFYANAGEDGEGVPWATMATHPSFSRWLERNPTEGRRKTALVVGCGMGDDAIELENLGFEVTAFDVSETAVGYCRKRFPDSGVDFLTADLLESQPHWNRKFDFVLEIYTVQALPPKYEDPLIENLAGFVAPGGRLLVVAGVGDGERTYENGPPWLLHAGHVHKFIAQGLEMVDQHREIEAEDDLDIDIHVTTFRRPAR